MAEFLYTNNAATTLASGVSDVATSMAVAPGTGALFPNPGAGQQFNITLIDGVGNYEIVKCTTRSTDTFTIVRAQEGTTAQAFSLGDRVELRVTAEALNQVVQETATQTVQNKTLDNTNTISVKDNLFTIQDGVDVTKQVQFQLSGLTTGTTRTLTVQDENGTLLTDQDLGVTVQAYDVDTAKLDVTQTFTTPQRGTATTDNDLSFDLNVTNNFTCTPTAGGTLTFTNIATGQSGFIKLVNGSNYAIAAHANTKVTSTFLATVSVTGTYIISYFSDGTNVYCATAGAMA